MKSESITPGKTNNPFLVVDDRPTNNALSPNPNGPHAVVGIHCTVVSKSVVSTAVSRSTPALPAVRAERLARQPERPVLFVSSLGSPARSAGRFPP